MTQQFDNIMNTIKDSADGFLFLQSRGGYKLEFLRTYLTNLYDR